MASVAVDGGPAGGAVIQGAGSTGVAIEGEAAEGGIEVEAG